MKITITKTVKGEIQEKCEFDFTPTELNSLVFHADRKLQSILGPDYKEAQDYIADKIRKVITNY